MNNLDSRIKHLVQKAGLGSLISASKVDGGLSNNVLILKTTCGQFAYRTTSLLHITGGNSSSDRAIASIAGNLGLGPEIVFSSEDGCETISKWIDGAPPTRRDFHENPRLIAQAIRILDCLHATLVDIDRFSVTALIDRYLTDLDLRPCEIRIADVERLRWRARRLQETIENSAVCHNDPMPKNWLWNGERLWLLDFEFAGIFDPTWDLATIANECGQPDSLLACLCSEEPSRQSMLHRVRAWIPIVDGLWALYAAKMSMNSMDVGRRETLLRVARERWSRYSVSY